MTEPPDPNESTELPVADPNAELPAPDEAPERISLAVRLAVLVVIIVPLLGVVAAPFIVWGWGFRWTDLGLLLSLYVLTALGITVGYHRLFVHRSFETNIVVKFVFAVLGSMAVQGPLLMWVAKHRRHHQHADTAGDPHSPHGHGAGVLGVLRGVWHAHIGWLFDPDPPDLDRYVRDNGFAVHLAKPGEIKGVHGCAHAGELCCPLFHRCPACRVRVAENADSLSGKRGQGVCADSLRCAQHRHRRAIPFPLLAFNEVRGCQQVRAAFAKRDCGKRPGFIRADRPARPASRKRPSLRADIGPRFAVHPPRLGVHPPRVHDKP